MPNTTKLTKSAQQLRHQEYGFRTDAQSATSLFDPTPEEILNYEINELSNDDIINTLKTLYNLDFKSDPATGNYPIDPIIKAIRQLLKIDNDQPFYLIWLVADWHACFELYADGHINPKTMYDIPEGFDMPFIDVYQVYADDRIISDVGYDGQLIATTHEPKPMHGFNY